MENSNKNTDSELFRPKTRGELYDKIKEGIKCEVVASNESFTSLALQTIAIIKKEGIKFKTSPSKNIGWVIFEKSV